MNRYVFIVEDQLKDLDGFFLCLNDLLLDVRTKDAEERIGADSIKLFFLHIRWKNDGADDEEKAFMEKVNAVKAHIKKTMGMKAIDVRYCQMLLDNSCYTPETSQQYADTLYTKIRDLMADEQGNHVAFPYVVLMDVILNNDPKMDYKWIQEGKSILSSCLYRRLPTGKCVVYSEYPPAPVCEKWANDAGMNGEIMEREFITRSRAIYAPFEEKLYHALALVSDQE